LRQKHPSKKQGAALLRPHPAGDGPPDLVRRIFLNEMDPRHRLLGQCWPPADEVEQRIIGEDRTWLSLQEQLGHIARPQPVFDQIVFVMSAKDTGAAERARSMVQLLNGHSDVRESVEEVMQIIENDGLLAKDDT
jgi:hypothetical protein